MERVYIDRHGTAPKVFVKFTSPLSALRVSPAISYDEFYTNSIARQSMHLKDETLVAILSPPYFMTQKLLKKASTDDASQRRHRHGVGCM